MSGQDVVLFLVEKAFTADHSLILHHDSEGFGGPSFPLSESLHRLFAGGVAAQMETSDALDRHNASVQNGPAGSCDGLPPDDPGLHTASGGLPVIQ